MPHWVFEELSGLVMFVGLLYGFVLANAFGSTAVCDCLLFDSVAWIEC